MEFGMLGPLEVWRDGQALVLGGAKQRALLAILLIDANHIVSVERISDLLWPEEGLADPAHVIEVYVSQLRKVLDPGGAPYRVLGRRASGYVLNVDGHRVDSARFEAMVVEAASLPPDRASALLSQAIALWRGPALADFAGEAFTLSEASRLNELRLHALEERIDADLALGRHAQLVGELGALVHEHPLRERLCRQLMLALYRSGRQAEASDLYQQTRARLVEEVGIEPGPDMQALLKRILRQDPGLAAQPWAEASVDSGLLSGTVTFLLTDVEESTRRWENHPEEMRRALRMHDTILGRQVDAHEGIEVESGREGDSVLAVFARASDAISAAIAIQMEFAAQSWPQGADLHIRIAIHSGEAELRNGHYYGRSVYRCARLLAIGHGGQVLLSQAAHNLVVDAMPKDASLLDMGSHRLRDLERPEHVYQVTASGMRTEFPPLASLDPRRHNLPISMTSFVGRASELSELKDHVASSRMVTVVGSGGTGKTRLAMQAAAEVVGAFADGVWLVELAPIAEPALVSYAIAKALGVLEEPGQVVQDTLARWLQPRRVLLVLDNCEHLVGEVSAVADRILRECPEVRVLATSREALRVAGEVVVRVGPLADEDAVYLFVERCKAVRSDFRVTTDNGIAVAEICRRVERIPLAIELAAGRSRMMSPAEIRERLRDSFQVLGRGDRSADPRHQTLQAAIDWSYRLLSSEEQLLLIRLSVFMGGFTLDAAEEVCQIDGVDGVLELLGQLVDKSLVSAQEVQFDRTRYSLLEAVREYGAARLGEQHAVARTVRRFASYFLGLAEQPHTEVSGPERTRWVLELSAEIDNFRAVFDSALVDDNVRLRLAVALLDLWDARGDYTEARVRMEAAVRATSERNLTRARALLGLASLAGVQANPRIGVEYGEQSLALFRELSYIEGEAACLEQLGQFAFQLEDFEVARQRLNEALEIATRARSEQLRSVCVWRLGMVALATKDLRGARSYIETSLAIGRAQADPEMVVLSLDLLGNVALWERRLDEARGYLREALEIWGRDGNSRQVANLLESLAAVSAAAGNRESALRLGGAAEGLRQRSSVTPISPLHREFGSRLDAIKREPAGETLWAQATRMSRDEAVAYALSESAIPLA